MAWTHLYDLLMKIISMVLAILILIALPFVPDHGVFILVPALALFFVLYYFLFRTLSTLLYGRYTLGMNLTWAQAKTLDGAFSPIIPLKWLPMKNLKELAPENKYNVALATYEQWSDEKKRIAEENKSDFKNARQSTQMLTVIMVVLVVYFLIASFLNLPPSDFITAAYCKAFNTESYYPMLNAIILIVPTYLIFKLIDKDIR